MKTTIVIFGITGDLSRRKLLPALSALREAGHDFDVVGVSRRQVDVATLLTEANAMSIVDQTTIFTMDLADVNDYHRLRTRLSDDNDRQILMYLSVPPAAAASITELLAKADLNRHNVKILFEKPFGFDVESAKDFIEQTAKYFNEDQLYRIDHYMAKEVAAEIMKFRAESQHDHRWDRRSISSVEVIASETIGVEGRTVFYEQTGALRDVLQGHLLQLLTLIIMNVEGISSLDEIAQRRLIALENLKEADVTLSIRGQYEGYDEEVDNVGSQTETFVTVDLSSRDSAWNGVVLRLITGKKLDAKRSAIEINYHDGSSQMFEENLTSTDAYQRVLLDAIAGRRAIFTTSPEIVRAWEIVEPLQYAWSDDSPLVVYPSGSTPAAIRELAHNTLDVA